MRKLKTYFILIRRIWAKELKQVEFVWEDLKKFHKNAPWTVGLYENEKRIETLFPISTEKNQVFHYQINERCYSCRVMIWEHYPIEQTSELFVLAQHFNNILRQGKVIVDVYHNLIEYRITTDIKLSLLDNDLFEIQMQHHFHFSSIFFGIPLSI